MAVPLIAASNVLDSRFDAVILVADSFAKVDGELAVLQDAIQGYLKINANANSEVSIVPCSAIPSGRLILSPCGPLNRDWDDSRNIYDAALAGAKRAAAAGCRQPLLCLGALVSLPSESDEPWAAAPYPILCAVLGALQGLYVPLEAMEAALPHLPRVAALGVPALPAELLTLVSALEAGRRVARDIGGSDPERMAAPRIVEYLRRELCDSCIDMQVEQRIDPAAYPLMAAVDRCAAQVPRHAGQIVHLTYQGAGPIEQTLMLVGKGITYDTGGADIKAGGHMAGMHRDKCGAATVAGFMAVLAELRPPHLRVLGSLACVRNSVGSECYVADEIITSRAGVRVRVGNTDAEGRMVMADLLCRMKELAVEQPLINVRPHLFTMATLTGHVIRAYGSNYTATMDNGAARRQNFSPRLAAAGALLADPMEVSTMRREDWAFHAGRDIYEDAIQCNNEPSTMTPRGHQFPPSFMMRAAGLDKYGVDSLQPLAYTHLDIAGSSGPFPGMPTGAPILALAAHYLLPRILKK